MRDERNVCVVTGTRADYGLLYWLMKALEQDPDFGLQVIVTGMHLCPEFGLTFREIERDGIRIDARVDMLLSGDSAAAVTKSVGLAVIGFADAYERLNPDLVVLLGDRFETLAAAQAAMLGKYPIAHLCGGDTTEGAYDEAIRHSITKMSQLHFVTNRVSAARVRQLGEHPDRIYDVGSLGVESVKRLPLLSKERLAQELPFTFRKRNVLVTFHPATLEDDRPEIQFRALLEALDTFDDGLGILLTKPNADTGGRILISMIEEFVSSRPHARAFASLGQLKYLSAVSHVDAVVGNSSSGIYEVPALRKPTVNIGDRQKGRLQAASIVNCDPHRDRIADAIRQAFSMDCFSVVHPYGAGRTSSEIMAVLRRIPDYKALIKKSFHEVNA